MSRFPTALTSSMLPGLTPGILPSLGGAGGAVPAGAAGVTVGAGKGPLASGIGAALSIVVGLSEGAAVGFAGAEALASGEDWLVEAGAGVCVVPDDWATNIGANSKLTAAVKIATPEPFAESLRISTSTGAEQRETHLTALPI
jgi:hypothetical protein